ncbi:MAG: hypothetical protein KGL39_23885 [Patescibacteria group bacterium]|nr:hypothetical protein [Patescibacteria group bacterium]
MLTPEGRTKKKVREKLRAMGGYVFSPVQMGMGATTLDDLCCIGGRFVGIEYKAPGGVPTKRQLLTMKQIRDAGGIALWGDSVEGIMEELKMMLGMDE